MRKFKFFALAFAALSFAACSDDAIDGQGGNTGTIGDGTPAYLTIAFSSNEGSSTRTEGDGTNTGDEDGDPENSGHTTPGTADEIAVKQALVVAYSTERKASFAKLYGSDALHQTTPGTGDGFVITDTKSQSYVSANPIRLETGHYNVLVVINPVNSLTSMLGTGVETTENTTVEGIYNAILGGKYSYTPTGGQTDNYYDAANSIGNATNGFMMTNRAMGEAILTEDNTEATPAVATVTVERTLSKITYRTRKTNNIYPVEVKTSTTKARTVDGAVSFDNGLSYQKVTLNVAVDSDKPEPNVVYAYYESDGAEPATYTLKGVYKQREGERQSVEDGDGTITLTVYEKVEPTTETEYDNGTTNKDNYYVAVDFSGDGAFSLEEEERSLILQADENSEASTNPSTWYVQLKGYALINLSKSVNYVKHTTMDPDATEGITFGSLGDGQTYLWTPNWAAKNDMPLDYADIEDAGDWFYNTLAQVSAESRTLSADQISTATYYRAMPDASDGESVTGSDDQHDDDYIADNPTGALMSYCFENSTDKDHQYHGLSTAISFMAQIYTDAECNTPLSTPLYRYASHVYTSLEAIQNAYGADTPSVIRDLVVKEEESQPITDEELEAANVVRYNGNTCYYYTTEIKHFDNGDPTASGIMEYAIMRNNIYSLSVTDITDIGDPFVDPTPNVPNESDNAYLSVQVTMAPWIVRYNDIEF